MSSAEARAAAFLDRDGTIIVERHYLHDPAGVELLPGAGGALRALREAGLALVLVTNQSGIARALYGHARFHAVQDRLESLLAAEGVRLDAVYYCPHHPDVTGACVCRKPGTALFELAARQHRLDLAASAWIGDQPRDVAAALRFGGTGVLLGDRPAGLDPRLHAAPDLAAAAALAARPRIDSHGGPALP